MKSNPLDPEARFRKLVERAARALRTAADVAGAEAFEAALTEPVERAREALEACRLALNARETAAAVARTGVKKVDQAGRVGASGYYAGDRTAPAGRERTS